MHDVSIPAAVLAGLISFLSPCVLPLVPPYLVYLAGTSLERLADAEPEPAVKRDTVFAALLFVAAPTLTHSPRYEFPRKPSCCLLEYAAMMVSEISPPTLHTAPMDAPIFRAYSRAYKQRFRRI
jgi:hypothetical protein